MTDPDVMTGPIEEWAEWGMRVCAPEKYVTGRVSPMADEQMVRERVAKGNAEPNEWQYEVVSRRWTRTRWEATP